MWLSRESGRSLYLSEIFVILVLYVDDLLLTSNCGHMLHDTKSFLSISFDTKDMGDAKYVLGIKIDRDRSIGRLGLSQRTYIDKVRKRYGMDKCAPGEVPVTKGVVFNSS